MAINVVNFSMRDRLSLRKPIDDGCCWNLYGLDKAS
jgi:hypothetical protein